MPPFVSSHYLRINHTLPAPRVQPNSVQPDHEHIVNEEDKKTVNEDDDPCPLSVTSRRKLFQTIMIKVIIHSSHRSAFKPRNPFCAAEEQLQLQLFRRTYMCDVTHVQFYRLNDETSGLQDRANRCPILIIHRSWRL